MKAFFNLYHIWGSTTYWSTEIGNIDFTWYEINDQDLVDAHIVFAESLKGSQEEALTHFEEAKSILESTFIKNTKQYVFLCTSIASIYQE